MISRIDIVSRTQEPNRLTIPLRLEVHFPKLVIRAKAPRVLAQLETKGGFVSANSSLHLLLRGFRVILEVESVLSQDLPGPQPGFRGVAARTGRISDTRDLEMRLIVEFELGRRSGRIRGRRVLQDEFAVLLFCGRQLDRVLRNSQKAGFLELDSVRPHRKAREHEFPRFTGPRFQSPGIPVLPEQNSNPRDRLP